MDINTRPSHETVPPRSVLHSLHSLGSGTPFVESAESYLRRLTASHFVERSKLHHFINHYGVPIYGDLRGQAARVDAPTASAAAFMLRTAELTRQPTVALLGLGWLAGCVTSQHCLRKRRAWCCLCFLEMQERGREPYVPMLWSFALLDCCPRHGMPLAAQCGNCGQGSPMTRERIGRIGECGSCGKSLAGGMLLTTPHAAPRSPSARDSAIADQLGRLLLAAQNGSEGIRRPLFSKLIVELHRRGYSVSPSELVRRMGVSKGTISDLLKGRGEPGLDLLLRLATALAIPLPDVVLGLSDAQLLRVGNPIVWPSRTKPRKDWGQVQTALRLESRLSQPASLQNFARQVGVDARHLSVTLPAESSVLRTRHRAAAKVARQTRVTEVVRKLIDAGTAYQSKRATARAIGIGRTRRCFQEAWSR